MVSRFQVFRWKDIDERATMMADDGQFRYCEDYNEIPYRWYELIDRAILYNRPITIRRARGEMGVSAQEAERVMDRLVELNLVSVCDDGGRYRSWEPTLYAEDAIAYFQRYHPSTSA